MLDWLYNPDVVKKKLYLDDTVVVASGDDDIKDIYDEMYNDYMDDRGPWWKLDSDDNDVTNG